MISWESILSVFNTKGTLLKWLQKLEKALKDGVLLSVTVNTVSEGVITLTFNFADGSTITTPQIDIPQGAQGPRGEQGEQGPQGETGEDYLFYSNITNLGKVPSAGDRFALTASFLNRTANVGDRFIGVFKYNNQSFLATCRVDTGNEAVLSLVVETTGAAGADIFNDFTSLKIDTTDATVAYIDGVAMITNARLIGYSSAGNEEAEIAVDLPIKAGENVTVDASSDDKSIQISATGGGGIEYAAELPTASATSPAFVQTPDGVLYRKKAVEGSSLLGTWVFNDTIPFLRYNSTYNISFNSYNQNYTSMTFESGGDPRQGTEYSIIKYGAAEVARGDNGADILFGLSENKTFEITDVSSLSDETEFESFITTIATKTGGGASVTYSYVALADA